MNKDEVLKSRQKRRSGFKEGLPDHDWEVERQFELTVYDNGAPTGGLSVDGIAYTDDIGTELVMESMGGSLSVGIA